MILIIACGNRCRQDDGAGLILAERLAAICRACRVDIRYLPVQQLVPELSIEIAADTVSQVWFVDTRQARDEKDTAVEIRPLDKVEPSPATGHQLTPETLLLYARALFDKRPAAEQPDAWQMTVPGFAFDHSETVTARCQACLAETFAQLAALRGDSVYA